jgi:hypothetical protein
MTRLPLALLFACLASAPALAQVALAEGCGVCTELDRQTMADPVAPSDLPPPPQKREVDRGRPIEIQLPLVNDTILVWHKPGAGLWVSDLAPGGIFMRPKKDKLAIELRF